MCASSLVNLIIGIKQIRLKYDCRLDNNWLNQPKSSRKINLLIYWQCCWWRLRVCSKKRINKKSLWIHFWVLNISGIKPCIIKVERLAPKTNRCGLAARCLDSEERGKRLVIGIINILYYYILYYNFNIITYINSWEIS